MAFPKLRIVIWCGNAANQKALANKIAAEFDVAGIVIDEHTTRRKKKGLSQLPGILLDRVRFHTIYNAWTSLMKYYNAKFPGWPSVQITKVPGINDPATKRITEELQPDLIIVSGTALIKEPLLSVKSKIGIINLHTGLSPYVKGGPNCTNWCIANNDFHLIGNTIMWLNAGIDAGNIITTETIDVINASSLTEAHRNVMEHAHDLYFRVIKYLSNSTMTFQSVPQESIDKGMLYLSKMWNTTSKNKLLRNWKRRKFFSQKMSPITVPLTVNKSE